MQLGTILLADKFINDGKDSAIINFVGQFIFKQLPKNRTFTIVFTLLDTKIGDKYNVHVTITDPSKEEIFEGTINEVPLTKNMKLAHGKLLSGVVSAVCPQVTFKKAGIYDVNVFVENITSDERTADQCHFAVEEVTSTNGK
ncbi:MAG: hypothetical protein K0S80_5028 [Neobacillus sp.]|jgi:hypothetical protein|nr:hypothetical protein [Neobacillus sp.]